MVSKPSSTKRSRMAKEVASSAVHPKTFPPRTRGAVWRPERPRGLLSMEALCRRAPDRTVSGGGVKNGTVHVAHEITENTAMSNLGNPNVAVWFEIPAADFRRAVAFYETVFDTK